MTFEFTKFILIIIGFAISLGITSGIKNRMMKILCFAVSIGFFVYSGIGMAFYSIDREYLFIVQYIISAIGIPVTLYLQQGTYRRYNTIYHNIDEGVFALNDGLIPKLFAILYIFTFVFPFLYPSIQIQRMFQFSALVSNYQALTSTYKLQLQNDGIYQLVCSTFRTLALPWFYVFLYRIKDRPVKFIVIYLIPVYLYAVSNNYISRNELTVFAVFLYVYLYKEKVVSQRALRLIAIIGIPVVLMLYAELFYLRVGIKVTSFRVGELIQDVLSREINFVKNYPTAVSLQDQVPVGMFFLYVTTCFIPMSIRSFFGIREINMARVLSNNILNMFYGDRNYYLILPSVLGEGIMIFDEYFAWIYLVIFAIFLCWFLKRVTRDDSMEYLAIYFIIDVVRQLRGGSQFIISAWTASIIPFIIVCYLVRQLVIKKESENRTW